VIVQTREPNHPTIVATVTGRFTAFARYELEFRKKLNYPPWGRLLRIIVSSPDQQEAFQGAAATKAALQELVRALHSDASASDNELNEVVGSMYSASILGPAPAPLERLRGRYRWHILVKSNSSRMISHLAKQIHQWRETQKQLAGLRVILDVDPYDML
jgi:primosomal protein N' (replication factor Y)